MKKLICVLLFLCLEGCATDYQELGLNGGYQEMKLSENSYLVEFESNEFTSESLNFKHALRRSAELTKKDGYKYFEISKCSDKSSVYRTPIKSRTTSHTSISTYGSNVYKNYDSYGNGSSSTIVSRGNTIVSPGISLIIKMLNDSTNDSLDADTILSNFKNEDIY